METQRHTDRSIPRLGEFLHDPHQKVFGTVVAARYDANGCLIASDLELCSGARVECPPALLLESVEETHPEVGRLEGAPTEADFPSLEFILRRIATETGATFTVETSGEYDRHAG